MVNCRPCSWAKSSILLLAHSIEKGVNVWSLAILITPLNLAKLGLPVEVPLKLNFRNPWGGGDQCCKESGEGGESFIEGDKEVRIMNQLIEGGKEVGIMNQHWSMAFSLAIIGQSYVDHGWMRIYWWTLSLIFP